MTEMRALSWRPRTRDGALGEKVRFEVEASEAERLTALARQVETLPPGQERTELLSELSFFMDVYAVFPGTMTAGQVSSSAVESVTETIAEVAAAEANGFVMPQAVREAHSFGQLSLTSPGALRPEQVAAPVEAERLPDPVNTVGRFHADPKPTELAAAVKAYPRTGTQARLVLDAIGLAGEKGLIDEEIAVAPGVSDTAHRTRRNALVEAGWVMNSGRTRKSKSKSDAIVWVLTEVGAGQWRHREAS